MSIPPLLKLIIVAAIASVLGYFGLDVSRDEVSDAIDQQFGSGAETQVRVEGEEYQVVNVIDGDTFTARRNGDDITVRLIGIDTPEVAGSPAGAECFGAEASAEAKRLLVGASVQLETDPSQATYDRFDRLLAYATFSDGRDVGEVLIAGGFAREFTYADPYLKQAMYRPAEQSAESTGVGIWNCE